MGHYVSVEPGVNIYVEDLNPEGKKTIVFIHGWPLNHQQFEYQFDVLPAMGIAVSELTGGGLESRINQ